MRSYSDGTSLLYQIAGSHKKKRKILIINFEDFALSAENLGPSLIEDLISIYKQEVYSERDFILMLDEVQNVRNWHKCLLPFSFKEYLHAMGIDTLDRLKIRSSKNEILKNLIQYMKWGGFPEVVLSAREESTKEILLTAYAQDVVMRDVALRKNIDNLQFLKWLATYLAQNISSRLTYRKLQNLYSAAFGEKVSTTTIANYLSYFEEAFIFFKVEHIALSEKRKLLKPFKIYIVDTGLRRALYPSPTSDVGRILENIVFLHLKRTCDQVYYYLTEKIEVDFICTRKSETYLINVSYVSKMSDLNPREIKSLLQPDLPDGRRIILTWDLRESIKEGSKTIELIPVYEFLLEAE